MEPFFVVLLDREYFNPLVIQCVLIGLQLLLLPLHGPGGGLKAPSEPFFLKGVLRDYKVLGTEALILLRLG